MADILTVHGQVRIGGRVLPVDVRAGARRIGVVGPSGAGKTTLVRALAGFVRVGRIAVRGAIWEDGPTVMPAWQRGVGWCPQEATLLPHASVRANLTWADPALDPIAVAGPLGLLHLLDRQPRNLSGGERQRVALGRALLSARTLLLLDEPFTALDRPRRDAVAEFVNAFAAARDLPVVLVSHDDRDVERLTDLVVHVSETAITQESS